MDPNTQAVEPIWGWQSELCTIADRAKHIFGNDILSDVTFRIQPPDSLGVDIKAHKCIYYDQIGPFNKWTAFSTLYAAKKYGIPVLKNACEQYLKQNVAADNCLAWFIQARLYDEINLENACMEKIDLYAAYVLQSADFLEIDLEVLKIILCRETVKAKEVDVCNAVTKWAKHQCEQKELDPTGANQRSVLGEALFLIRFPTMTSEEVASGPAKSGLLLAEEISQLFQFWYAKTQLPEKFVSRIRVGSHKEVTVSRFESTNSSQNWTYMAGFPDVIKFSITSTAQPCSDDLNEATVHLVAVGVFVQSPLPEGVECTATMKIFVYEMADPNGYRCLRDHPRELKDFRHTWTIPGKKHLSVAKFKLRNPFPVEFGKQYALSLQTSGMQRSFYGSNGKAVVNTSGICPLSVQFSDALDPEYDVVYGSGYHSYNERQIGYNAHTRTSTCGTTTFANGQFPQLYFETS
ncbi:BTB/POZ domain-containing protein 2-like isoform X2 [Paramacrobiotus metropolitanus]|uniref:BTB/POZ domain-containing protein 2-like isoform X2 n=1 Tax=Paramacrobiotus metropolitanus TaxID=2943436 RepID=UPI002445AF4B|nr:BTB/POZ domain-containing protein 2-like isoform X2 [Paramacrobiotus metropolitanus]